MKIIEAKKHDWQNVDWRKSTREIAEELPADPSFVSLMRKRYAPGTRRKFLDWSEIDWSKSNEEIARKLRVTDGYVSTMRKQYAPETVRQPKYDWSQVDWSKSNKEIASELQVDHHSLVADMRRRYAKTLESNYYQRIYLLIHLESCNIK